jgi:hypothetical protein
MLSRQVGDDMIIDTKEIRSRMAEECAGHIGGSWPEVSDLMDPHAFRMGRTPSRICLIVTTCGPI